MRRTHVNKEISNITKERFVKDQFLGFSGSSSPYQSTSWKPFVLIDLSIVSTGSGPASSVASDPTVSTFSTAMFVPVVTVAVAPDMMLALSASVSALGTRVIGVEVDARDEVAK
jgi:hypothetical protein